MAETTAPEVSEAPAYPLPRTCPYQPPAGYAGLRGEGPLRRVTLYDGRRVWLVTRHADARRLLTDPRLSSDRSRPDFPVLLARLRPARDFRVFIGMDPPDHTRYRRMLISDFSVHRIRAMPP